MNNSLDLPTAIAVAADSKTDSETVILEVGEVLAITGWFVVTSGANSRQVRAITEEIERSIDEAGGPKPQRIEGLDDCKWVLMDYGDVIVHIFDNDTRDFYDLERLWRDVPRVEWS
ncbi:MAG: ribosome silencing factor [Actinomycetota bacterium]|jgi:ribosome-associated protein